MNRKCNRGGKSTPLIWFEIANADTSPSYVVAPLSSRLFPEDIISSEENQVVRALLLVASAIVTCGCQNPSASPKLGTHPLSGAESANISLEGKWKVVSSSGQSKGATTYDFRRDTVTMDDRKPAANFRIDDTKTPKRLIINQANKSGDSQTYAFEIRNGELWMCRDFGDQPITKTSLWPGSGGWVTGLRRVE